MNDRYAFRALHNGKWVYGSYYQHGNDHFFYTSVSECVDPKTNSFENIIKRLVVDPKTVSLCTGLKDKNGKLIFEGDILKISNDEYDEESIDHVVFKNGSFCFNRYRFWNDGVHEWYSLENVWREDVEIIGNIHQNLELLRAK